MSDAIVGAGEPVPKPRSKRFEASVKVLQRGDLGPLDPAGQGGTVFTTLDGAAVAVVPLDLYRRMVAGLAPATPLGARPVKAPPAGPPLGLSTIERDPEVAEFLRSRFRGGVTVAQIRDACRNSFGDERTPSHARIQRFREALKRVR